MNSGSKWVTSQGLVVGTLAVAACLCVIRGVCQYVADKRRRLQYETSQSCGRAPVRGSVIEQVAEQVDSTPHVAHLLSGADGDGDGGDGGSGSTPEARLHPLERVKQLRVSVLVGCKDGIRCATEAQNIKNVCARTNGRLQAAVNAEVTDHTLLDVLEADRAHILHIAAHAEKSSASRAGGVQFPRHEFHNTVACVGFRQVAAAIASNQRKRRERGEEGILLVMVMGGRRWTQPLHMI